MSNSKQDPWSWPSADRNPRLQRTEAGMLFGVAPYMRRGAAFQMEQPAIWGVRMVRYGRVAAVGLLVASAIILPTSEASARCWHNGWGWRCGPGLLALPFVAAGAVVAGAAAIATAPVRAIVGPPYYAPPPAYYPPPGYYYGPPGYYYGPPAVSH
jgi:hypothetical protein